MSFFLIEKAVIIFVNSDLSGYFCRDKKKLPFDRAAFSNYIKSCITV